MKSQIGEFIVGPIFSKLIEKSVAAAISEANANGLPKAYAEQISDTLTYLKSSDIESDLKNRE